MSLPISGKHEVVTASPTVFRARLGDIKADV
jgi:hypothetical protein